LKEQTSDSDENVTPMSFATLHYLALQKYTTTTTTDNNKITTLKGWLIPSSWME